MTHVHSFAVTAEATFGRDGAMFQSLLGFVGQLSVVLWGLVFLTAIIRFVTIPIYRRGAARTALVESAAPSVVVPTTPVPTTAGVIDLVQPAAGEATQLTAAGQVDPGPFASTPGEKDTATTDSIPNAPLSQVLQPAAAPEAQVAVVAPVRVGHRGARRGRSEPRSAQHVPSLASNYTES
jgi:hypothetical protein